MRGAPLLRSDRTTLLKARRRKPVRHHLEVDEASTPQWLTEAKRFTACNAIVPSYHGPRKVRHAPAVGLEIRIVHYRVGAGSELTQAADVDCSRSFSLKPARGLLLQGIGVGQRFPAVCVNSAPAPTL